MTPVGSVDRKESRARSFPLTVHRSRIQRFLPLIIGNRRTKTET